MTTLPLLLLTFLAAPCPDLSGNYILQGEDGRVRVKIEQTRCERVTITRVSSSYAGTAERHRLKLNGVVQADSGWFGGRERNRVIAKFVGNELVLEIFFASRKATRLRYSFRLTPTNDICSHLVDSMSDTYYIQARIAGGTTEAEDVAARRSMPIKACPS
jgi:hypothetical protein